MKTTRRAFIKEINWVLAGIIGMLGFAGCNKSEPLNEYGTPHADYTVKGTVVNKVTKKPIEGIRVGYSSRDIPNLMYGVPQVPYTPKAHVLTNSKGEFKLTDTFFPEVNKTLPVVVEDIDGEKNGSFQSEYLEVDFSKAERTKNPNRWYEGEFTVTVNVELSEKEETDE